MQIPDKGAWSGQRRIGSACSGELQSIQIAADVVLSVMQERFDWKLGTSERGSQQSATQLELPEQEHALIAFGGPLGLEDCYQKDSRRLDGDVTALFDMRINTCPNQGSRTIRTEEAILISM